MFQIKQINEKLMTILCGLNLASPLIIMSSYGPILRITGFQCDSYGAWASVSKWGPSLFSFDLI